MPSRQVRLLVLRPEHALLGRGRLATAGGRSGKVLAVHILTNEEVTPQSTERLPGVQPICLPRACPIGNLPIAPELSSAGRAWCRSQLLNL